MSDTFTSKDLAVALGVSESSLKRWADAGRIAAWRTEGGHRRFHLRDAINFARELGITLRQPQAIGLTNPASDDEIVELMLARNEPAARAALLGRYAQGAGIAELCDGPLRTAMHAVGDLWKHDISGVLIEHHVTSLCIELLVTLKSLLRTSTGKLVLGGAPEGDPYIIPSLMCATVLQAQGFCPINFGADTPTAVLLRAVEQHPTVSAVWLAVTTPLSPTVFASLAELATELAAREIRLVAGGRHVHDLPAGITRVASMHELIATL